MSWEMFVLVPGSPLLSGVIWLVVGVALLYLARSAAHQAIASASRLLHHACKLAARSVLLAEQRLKLRNTEVLLAAGREAAERIIEREFERIDASVQRDLAEYPALQRQMSEAITRLEQDYHASAEVPPEPPAWAKVVDAVAKIAPKEPVVGEILEDIHDSMVRAQRTAIEQYRNDNSKRHRILSRMMPLWRKVARVLGEMDKRVNRLLERSTAIDRHMEAYEDILNRSPRAERMLSSSSLTQFFIAGAVLAVAIGGAIINFHLIARPMQEMVGGSSYIMGYKAANIAALVIILVEVAMGLFLMESLRITRLFPIIAALDDRLRVRMIWVAFLFLLALASIEAGLAFMREKLAQDDASLVASLVGGQGEMNAIAANVWITTAAQMGMGFILPFALTFVAIPLESFVHSSRTVLGLLGQGLLRALSFLLRLIGNVFRHGGNMLIRLYDLVIFLPLWVEQRVLARRQMAPTGQIAEDAS
ncbi:hypothetical protein [Sulfurivermis fontis]|uniref:hypothetical protein n=1 Tax=Sulfurivermis fontis TaxID=1972068 RepID=UPI000FD7F5F7|nr:hypothetical protein [Sulfurivermis fontis]